MKKWLIFIPVCIACIGTIVYLGTNSTKHNVIKMVKENLDSYTTIAEQALSSSIDLKKLKIKGVEDISSYNSKQVDFTCYYGGFASQSSYSGFYYSSDDIPRAFQGVDVPFIESEGGLKWQEVDGDNWCYVEKIYDNWYYFEMHF